jgi:valyl-tRNA synthetase
VAGWVLDQILVVLHPFMPFITEELWNALGERPYPLILAKWPMPDARALDAEAGPEIEAVIDLITEIRRVRMEFGLGFGAVLPLHVFRQSEAGESALYRYQAAFKRMARIDLYLTEGWVDEGRDPPTLDTAHPVIAAARGLRWVSIETPLYGARLKLPADFDVAAERARLEKAAQAAEKERDSLGARLENPSFLERAKAEAVEKAREDHAAKASDAERYRAALARLG